MSITPWRHIANWNCTSCGDCCKLYSVVLNFQEWLRIVKSFGVEQTVPGLDKLFIKRREDGSCAFLSSFSNTYACNLQYMKPRACQIWPFKILTRPSFGYGTEAAYHYGEHGLYIYVDSMCSGLKYGTPTPEFAHQTLKEFVEIATGFRNNQHKTTGKISLPRPYLSLLSLSTRSHY
ncbi:YkgJ family cysteine cluster protein [Candidatus Bathyarchaeota archaeon]|nr:YkgJ family cysteine cluster protein [Candidatus Bathyarchaeota archaeon]